MTDLFADIPAELKELSIWNCVQFTAPELDPKNPSKKYKVVKKMYHPDRPGIGAASTNPDDWTSYDTCVDKVELGEFDAVSIAIIPPYFGIDLDDCRNSETGIVADWATEIIERIDSYTEASVSGTGVHIICRGTIPPGHNRRGKFEMYSHSRFLITTGDVIRPTIQERTDQAAELFYEIWPAKDDEIIPSINPNSLTDAEILQKAAHCKTGHKFSMLWAGEWMESFDSQSEADLALCCSLAFWTGNDASRIDSLFQQSGLWRPKWNQHSTYKRETIKRAIRTTKSTYIDARGRAENKKQTVLEKIRECYNQR